MLSARWVEASGLLLAEGSGCGPLAHSPLLALRRLVSRFAQGLSGRDTSTERALTPVLAGHPTARRCTLVSITSANGFGSVSESPPSGVGTENGHRRRGPPRHSADLTAPSRSAPLRSMGPHRRSTTRLATSSRWARLTVPTAAWPQPDTASGTPGNNGGRSSP